MRFLSSPGVHPLSFVLKLNPTNITGSGLITLHFILLLELIYQQFLGMDPAIGTRQTRRVSKSHSPSVGKSVTLPPPPLHRANRCCRRH